MATDVRVVPTLNDVTLDADWRTAAQAIEAALLAVGFTKIAGPTQMDLATVAVPVTPNFAVGYHYWQFTDAKQATRPIYVRTAYGRLSASRFGFRFQVSGGWTNAGASVGWAMTEETLGPATAPQAGATVTLRTSYTPYGLWMSVQNSVSLTASSWGMWVMRSWGGADFGDLIHKYGWIGNSAIMSEVGDLGKLIVGGRVTTLALIGVPSSLDTGMPLVGSDAAIWPLLCCAGRIEPVPGVCFVRTTEVGAGTFQADMLGATRNYMQMAGIWFTSVSGTNPAFGLIWE